MLIKNAVCIDDDEVMTQCSRVSSSLLARLQLFRNVDLSTIADCLQRCAYLRLEPGVELLSPQRANHNLYLVVTGRLGIHLEGPGWSPVSLIEAGECVGEMSLLENKSPSAYVVASEPSQLLQIPEPVFWELLDRSIQINRNMLHILSMRVRVSNVEITASLHSQKAFQREATIDALTGLHNRRWMDDMFAQELVHSQREGWPLCLLMMDVDHFKAYNDRHGHLAGDRALAGVARALRSVLRPNDMLARYGGEEFSLLLPHTREPEALAVAERLRHSVEEAWLQDADGGELPPVTLSVGVSPERGQDLVRLIGEADAALYRAKKAGRNRVSR